VAREEALPRLPSGPSAELAFGEVVGWCDILPTPGRRAVMSACSGSA
jgi:hypothetical protein